MAVGAVNTFSSSWAGQLETETLLSSKFNTGGKISIFLFSFLLFAPLQRQFPPQRAAPGSIQPSLFMSAQGAGLGRLR